MTDVEGARQLFPALSRKAYFNTAAVALGNTRLRDGLTAFLDQWTEEGFDFVRAEAAADRAREILARLLKVSARDVALVPSVSTAAGLVAAQFVSADTGENLIIGAQEYSSNHFPWRQLEARGYDVRQVPFRNGGIDPDAVEGLADGGTCLIAVSSIQTASGHRTDISAIAAIARKVGAWLFVDGSQSVGAVSMEHEMEQIDFLATSDHKFLLNAGRGMGYLYIKPDRQSDVLPLSAGWKAGDVPFQSFFGPEMNLSETASRFDNSISWLAAIGDEICLQLMEEIGFDVIFQRNIQLGNDLRSSLSASNVDCAPIPAESRSHIVSVPIDDRDPAGILSSLKDSGVIGSVRDRHLRLAPHFYNNNDDVIRCAASVSQVFE